jgi:xanthine dehydrogenase YagS FAD-binding subunit
MQPFAWVSPDRLEDALATPFGTVADAMVMPPGAPAPGGDILKAGGLDLLDLMKEDLLAPRRLVDLRGIPDLDRIEEAADGEGLRIGALATLAAVAAHPVVAARYPMLAVAAGACGGPQIRNVATLGGNLLQRPRCWYFRSRHHHCLKKGGGHCFAVAGENQYHAIFDNRLCAIVHASTLATALVALGASAELVSARGAKRRVALEDFFVPPQRDLHRENDLRADILTAIHLPSRSADLPMAYVKQGERDEFDWPIAEVAVLLEPSPDGSCNGAAVVLGAAAPVPYRAKTAERVLIGKRVDEALAGEAGRAALDGAAPLAKNGYKVPLFEALVRRAILEAASRQ